MKKYISVFLLFVFFIILGTENSKAALQSNGNTPARYNVDQWMSNIRNMEALGGAMGLEETINSNLTSSSESNGIDVHMQKNTEYGALAILSASSYGNPNKIENGGTTTGNVTGVVMNLNKEWVAGGTLSSSTVYRNAVGRYKNIYNYNYVPKNGDAISETAGWHGSGASQWLLTMGAIVEQAVMPAGVPIHAGIVRSYSGSIFSYYGYAGILNQWNAMYSARDAYWGKAWSSRAVVVVGEGI